MTLSESLVRTTHTRLQGLANLQSLSEVDGFSWIKTAFSDHMSDYAVSVVEGFAPAIFLVLSLVLAKHIIRWVIRHSCEYALISHACSFAYMCVRVRRCG
jgi:hypothetical protein